MPDAGAPRLLEVDIAAKTRLRDGARVEVIKGLRFGLTLHEVTCLLGPSGCGKTTALRIVMGLDAAYEGRVTPSAEDLKLGVVFQEPRLLPWRTVEQNVRLAAPTIRQATLEALLAELGLADWRRSGPNQLSLGMARRVALARALAVEPDLLILDEAFVSLDERGAETLRGIVFDAVDRRKVTVLMVTHNVREALLHSDTILMLAPRPTSVVETIALKAPRDERDKAWLAAERQKLVASAEFLELE